MREGDGVRHANLRASSKESALSDRPEGSCDAALVQGLCGKSKNGVQAALLIAVVTRKRTSKIGAQSHLRRGAAIEVCNDDCTDPRRIPRYRTLARFAVRHRPRHD